MLVDMSFDADLSVKTLCTFSIFQMFICIFFLSQYIFFLYTFNIISQ